jgi:hypothetical protein
MAKPITISIVGNAGPLKKSLKESDAALDKFGQGIKKFGIAAAVGIGALGAGIGVAIGKASDLEETVSKVGVIFGEAGADVKKFAKDAAVSLGQSNQQALDAAATFGIFGKSAGLAGSDLSKFSTDFVGLAADLASFNNTSPETAINAIGSALRGESEPLRAFGVLLNDATLKEAALTLGIYDGNGALTAQQKILAAQKVIYEQTTDAQGDFARTSDGLANSQKILKAQLADTVTEIGTFFLPIAVKAIGFLNDGIPIVNEFADALSQGGLGGVLGLTTEKFLKFYDGAGDTTRGIIATTIAVGGLYTAFKTLAFIETITKLVHGFTAAVNASTVSMAGFQTTSLGMLKTVGLVIASLAISIDSLLADNAFAARGLMESVAKFANLIIASIEATFNSAIIAVNLLNKAASFLPGVEIAPIGLLNFGRVREDFGSVGAFERGQTQTPGSNLSPGRFDPDFPRASTATPTIPAPTITAPTLAAAAASASGGGGGGSSRAGGGAAQGFGNLAASGLQNIGISSSGALIDFATGDLVNDQRTLPDVVNITVNTVSADANLPTLIVDALQQYNLYNGPLDVQIAV